MVQQEATERQNEIMIANFLTSDFEIFRNDMDIYSLPCFVL